MKTLWENIEPLAIGLCFINGTIFFVIFNCYSFASFKLRSMADKIERDGNLENFKVNLSKYYNYNLDFMEDLTYQIPEDPNYQKVNQFHILAVKVLKLRTWLLWSGIPLVVLCCLVMTALATGMVD